MYKVLKKERGSVRVNLRHLKFIVQTIKYDETPENVSGKLWIPWTHPLSGLSQEDKL